MATKSCLYRSVQVPTDNARSAMRMCQLPKPHLVLSSAAELATSFMLILPCVTGDRFSHLLSGVARC